MRVLALLITLCSTPAAAATLSGRVTDTNGGGMNPVDIDVYLAGTTTLVPTPGDSTDLAGNYSLTLPSGTYDLQFEPPAGSHFFRHLAAFVTVNVNTQLDVTLPRGHYLTGRVTSPGGAGVPLADLDFHSPATGDAATNVQDDKTDVNGYFTTLVDSAQWNVAVTAPVSEGLVPRLFPGVNLAGDADLGTVQLEDGSLVQGTVTDLGFFPVAGADLDVRPAGGGPKLWTPGDDADDTGAYAFIVPAGTYDITASPANGEPLAPATARSVDATADVVVPNLALPPGFELRGRCKRTDGTPVEGVDLDVDSLPLMRRLEVQGDRSDSGGDLRVLVSAWDFRVTLSPPVATKLVPARLDSVHVSGQTDLGDIVFADGHWVSGTVVEAGSGAPIAGANLDFLPLPSGPLAITPGDVTGGAGFFRVVLPNGSYRLRVSPPSAAHESLTVQPVTVSQDTVLALVLQPSLIGVAPGAPARDLALSPPWPNPARGEASVWFAAEGEAVLEVWDVRGRRVATLHRGAAAAPRAATWGGRDQRGAPQPAGLYFLRLSAPGRRTAALTRPLVLLR